MTVGWLLVDCQLTCHFGRNTLSECIHLSVMCQFIYVLVTWHNGYIQVGSFVYYTKLIISALIDTPLLLLFLACLFSSQSTYCNKQLFHQNYKICKLYLPFQEWPWETRMVCSFHSCKHKLGKNLPCFASTSKKMGNRRTLFFQQLLKVALWWQLKSSFEFLFAIITMDKVISLF